MGPLFKNLRQSSLITRQVLIGKELTQSDQDPRERFHPLGSKAKDVVGTYECKTAQPNLCIKHRAGARQRIVSDPRPL